MNPLVTATELAGLLGSATVLDVRWQLGGPPGAEEHRRGHVPGAVYVDLETDLADPPGPTGRHPLPETGRFQAAMRRAGVYEGRPVVVYDAVGGTSAARCWWLLRHHAHPDVRVLDGGLQAWVATGGEVEEGETRAEPGDFTARPGRMPVLDAGGALALARDGVHRLDLPAEPFGGHVPGAVSLPTSENLTSPTGRFRSREELAATYARAGVAPGRPVGAYCGSGVTAAHDVLALALIGVEAALYPGSWSEWVTDPSRPVATGG